MSNISFDHVHDCSCYGGNVQCVERLIGKLEFIETPTLVQQMALRRYLHLHGFARDDIIRSLDEHHLQRELFILERMESGFMAILPGHRLR